MSLFDQEDLLKSNGLSDLYNSLTSDGKIIITIRCLLQIFDRYFDHPTPEKYRLFLYDVLKGLIDASEFTDWIAFKKKTMAIESGRYQ